MLQEQYKKAVPELKKQLNLKTTMQVPRISKVVLSTCVSEAVKNPKVLNKTLEEFNLIAGQKMQICKAKKDAAQFKIRKGMLLGGSVTLRRDRMWTFLDKLIHFALPQVRDFKGLSPKSFDGSGNYSFGIKEHIVFPEVDYDKVESIRGFNITICTTAKDNKSAFEMLEKLGMPFRK